MKAHCSSSASGRAWNIQRSAHRLALASVRPYAAASSGSTAVGWVGAMQGRFEAGRLASWLSPRGEPRIAVAAIGHAPAPAAATSACA
jgi:hypothetical protein